MRTLRRHAGVLLPILIGAIWIYGCKSDAARRITRGLAGAAARETGHGDLAPIAEAAVDTGFYAAQSWRDVDEESEYWLGRSVTASLLAKYPRRDIQAATDYLTQIGLTLALASNRPDTYGGYHFAIVRSSEVNAFAAPGGFILITTATLEAARNEDEVAGILAHEIAHVEMQHALQSIRAENRKQIALTWVKAGVSTGGRQLQGPALAQAAQVFGRVLDDVVDAADAGYGRAMEEEADLRGAAIAQAAGYDPHALRDFLSRMESLEVRDGWFGTRQSRHPSVAERREKLDELIRSQGWSRGRHPARDQRFQTMAALKW